MPPGFLLKSSVHARWVFVVLIPVLLALVSFFKGNAGPSLGNNLFQITLGDGPDGGWRYQVRGTGAPVKMEMPVFEIDGKMIRCSVKEFRKSAEPATLSNGVTEYSFSGTLQTDTTLSLKIFFRLSDNNPVVRYKYVLQSSVAHRLTKSQGRDHISYFRTSLAGWKACTEVQFSNYDQKTHSYLLKEQAIGDRHFDDGASFMGPLLVETNGNQTYLWAYEHGSQYNNAFLQFELDRDRSASLLAVKGNYLGGQPLSPGNDYETIWFEMAGINGNKDQLAVAYRSFILKYLTLNTASRKPFIFYNTWGRQERVKWAGGTYRQSMNLRQTLEEIERAHRMGIDVFVIDTGWFIKTGDWDVNTDPSFYPDSLRQVLALLKKDNMKLGLWVNPLLAAESSRILERNRDCRSSLNGQFPPADSVWETEPSESLCLVSKYWMDFSDKLISLVQTLGVTYFKWDGIGQGDCDAIGHFHGTPMNSARERRDRDAFLQPIYMSRIIDKVVKACPEAIFDFDITEAGRAVGLAFLASGKFFASNNGPYFHNYDLASFWQTPLKNRNINIFVNPGPARGWFTRPLLDYDPWLPSILFLTHYQPDEPRNSQMLNLASLILGQNGIWGEILKTSPKGVELFGGLLGKYKQVAQDITEASPVTVGRPGEMIEIHEKINPENGKGVVVLFYNGSDSIHYITEHRVDSGFWSNEGVRVSFDEKGRAIIDAGFEAPGAKIIFFGLRRE
jgi:alpha-galactosidase